MARVTLMTPARFEWTCIRCRTRWSQAGWVHVLLACTKCTPPRYEGEMVYSLGTEEDLRAGHREMDGVISGA